MVPEAMSDLAAAIRKSKKFPRVNVPPKPSMVLAANVRKPNSREVESRTAVRLRCRVISMMPVKIR
jgi:hypothetical protein